MALACPWKVLEFYNAALPRVPTSSGNHGKPGKSLKNPCMEKSWNLLKPEYSWENHGIWWNNLKKPPVARHTIFLATSVQHLVFCLLVVQVLIISKCMHGLQECSVVAAFCIYAQHGEDASKRGGWNSHGYYIVDHGKSWKKSWNCVHEFLWEPCLPVWTML